MNAELIAIGVTAMFVIAVLTLAVIDVHGQIKYRKRSFKQAIKNVFLS